MMPYMCCVKTREDFKLSTNNYDFVWFFLELGSYSNAMGLARTPSSGYVLFGW